MDGFFTWKYVPQDSLRDRLKTLVGLFRPRKHKTGDTEVPLVIGSTIGTDPTIPPDVRRAYLEEHACGVIEKHRRVANLLVERLLADGLEHRIQIEDVEALCATEKTPRGRSPMLMRKIIVEFILILRDERREAESANVQGVLSLPG